jgi:hypothetical protein
VTPGYGTSADGTLFTDRCGGNSEQPCTPAKNAQFGFSSANDTPTAASAAITTASATSADAVRRSAYEVMRQV